MKGENTNRQPMQKSIGKQGCAGIFSHTFFDLPFRSFFLLAPFFAALSLSLWLMVLNGWYSFSTEGLSATVWHIHEMVFGFSATIAVAFILTAVQTWTGKRSLHGRFLAAVLALWLVIRLALWINNSVSVDLAILAQLLWWLIIIVCYSRIVISTQNKRNYLFIPILVVMGALNLSVLLAERFDYTALAMHMSRSMILVMGLLIGIVGGRVIPFFTQKGLASAKAITSPQLLSQCLIIVSVAGIGVFSLSYFVPLKLSPAILMISAGSLHLLRICFWCSWKTLKVPLLWSLHLAYFLLSIGLILLGVSEYSSVISFSEALHLITVGGVSLMILSMISRVALGHTGRVLIVKPMIKIAFVMMFMAAIVRGVFPMLLLLAADMGLNLSVNPYFVAWNLGGLLWVLAMLIFCKTYLPIMISPKVHR